MSARCSTSSRPRWPPSPGSSASLARGTHPGPQGPRLRSLSMAVGLPAPTLGTVGRQACRPPSPSTTQHPGRSPVWCSSGSTWARPPRCARAGRRPRPRARRGRHGVRRPDVAGHTDDLLSFLDRSWGRTDDRVRAFSFEGYLRRTAVRWWRRSVRWRWSVRRGANRWRWCRWRVVLRVGFGRRRSCVRCSRRVARWVPSRRGGRARPAGFGSGCGWEVVCGPGRFVEGVEAFDAEFFGISPRRRGRRTRSSVRAGVCRGGVGAWGCGPGSPREGSWARVFMGALSSDYFRHGLDAFDGYASTGNR